ncbi:MAG: putative aminohydrolase SsnA, partial [Chloroflexi bacterium]|nr:putative aminohydrolase SsnA [Chloroflexota bacterium]
DGKIAEVAEQNQLVASHPEEDVFDAQGQYVMPGNICAHTHFYGAYSRGMAIPGKPAADFPEILEKLWWPLDKSLSYDDIRYSALVCLADAIRHGTTTLIDHHASPNAIDGSLDVIAQAVEQAGLRADLCYEVTDRDGQEKAMAGIKENARFIQRVQQAGRSKLSAHFGLHASLTLSDETLEACRKELPSDGFGFHIHVAEHPVDEYDAMAKSGTHVVDRLQKFGILGPRSIAVHAVHIDAREVSLLAQSQTWVTHQPRSNMNNAVGLPAVEAMLRAGIRVGLGNDGFSNAMWEDWKAAYLGHKLLHRDPRRMSATDVAQMAIYNNAALARQSFGLEKLGEIAPGAEADLIFVEYHPYTELTPDNLPWHMIFGFHESMISGTMVAGQFLMKDRKLLTLDLEDISEHTIELSRKAWERFQKRSVG